MLSKVYFCKLENVQKHYDREASSITGPIAAILLDDINKSLPHLPSFKPVISFSFSLYDPAKELGIYHEKRYTRDKVQRFRTLAERHPDLPKETDCERIIIFCNELFKDKADWTLWIICPDGKRSSASIARFIDALQIGTIVNGLDCVSTDWHNLFLSGMLAGTYGRLFASSLRGAEAEEALAKAKHEHNANFESAIRGKEDNS
jgi:hypothetical protein